MVSKKVIIDSQYENYRKWIESLPETFDEGGELIYDGRNRVRLYTMSDGTKIVIKRYKRPMVHQMVAYGFFCKSKMLRAYYYAKRLLECSIDTPAPIAFVEVRHFGLLTDGFFLSSYNPDPDCRILREEEGHTQLTNALAEHLVREHRCGFLHGDTNLSNFLYRPDESERYGFHISTIDINRSRFRENPTEEERMKCLSRLTHVKRAYDEILEAYNKQWNS